MPSGYHRGRASHGRGGRAQPAGADRASGSGKWDAVRGACRTCRRPGPPRRAAAYAGPRHARAEADPPGSEGAQLGDGGRAGAGRDVERYGDAGGERPHRGGAGDAGGDDVARRPRRRMHGPAPASRRGGWRGRRARAGRCRRRASRKKPAPARSTVSRATRPAAPPLRPGAGCRPERPRTGRGDDVPGVGGDEGPGGGVHGAEESGPGCGRALVCAVAGTRKGEPPGRGVRPAGMRRGCQRSARALTPSPR